jgi:hypothetical protein
MFTITSAPSFTSLCRMFLASHHRDGGSKDHGAEGEDHGSGEGEGEEFRAARHFCFPFVGPTSLHTLYRPGR